MAETQAPIPKEIFNQVRRIEIRTRRLVTETFGGKYLSVFKGRGMEFAEVREYVPGDDIRAIDWNVTARTGRPYIRQYQDERELTVVMACDLSGSQYFGTDVKLKKEVAAEIAALLAFSALENNDKIGLFLFTEGAELYAPPKKGRTHILSTIRNLLAFEPKRRGTAIGPSLDALNRHLKRRSIVFLISDFQDVGFDKAVRRTAVKHDLIPIVIEDRRESELPKLPAWLDLEDPETGERTLVHAGSDALSQSLRRRRETSNRELTRLFQSSGIDFIRIRADRPYVPPLSAFFKRRSKRFR